MLERRKQPIVVSAKRCGRGSLSYSKPATDYSAPHSKFSLDIPIQKEKSQFHATNSPQVATSECWAFAAGALGRYTVVATPSLALPWPMTFNCVPASRPTLELQCRMNLNRI